MYSDLSSQLTALVAEAVSGDEFDASRINDLMEQIQQAVPSMERDEVAALLIQVDEAMVLISKKKDEVNEDLLGIKTSRKALNGYDHLSDNHKEQRLYRRA